MDKKILLVVGVLGGRNFGPCNYQLLICGKFSNLSMISDPVDGNEKGNPVFNLELAWSIPDQKELHIHRMQKTPVKLEVCALKSGMDGPKEVIGYVVLEIKSTPLDEPKTPSWMRLLGGRFQDPVCPEILVSLSLETAKEEPIPPPIVKEREPKIHPELKGEGEYFQIGNETPQFKMYILTIMVVYTRNLAAFGAISSSDGFHFSLQIFDCDVDVAHFSSIEEPDFLAEKVTVRVFSTLTLIKKYLAQQKILRLALKSSNGPVIAEAGINLRPLVRSTTVPPISFDGELTLKGKNDYSTVGSPGKVPIVGVSVEFQIAPETDSEGDGQQQSDDSSQASGSVHEQPLSPPVNIPPPNRNKSQHQHNQHDDLLVDNSRMSQPQQHEYRFCVDLRKIEVFQTSLESCILRYSYPALNMEPSVVTYPSFKIEPGECTQIPHGYCDTVFAAQERHLDRLLAPVIKVEVLEIHEKNEELIGIAELPLLPVLRVKPIIDAYTRSSLRQVPQVIQLNNNQSERIGCIHTIISLCNIGYLNTLEARCNNNNGSGDKLIPIGIHECTQKAINDLEEWKKRQKNRCGKQHDKNDRHNRESQRASETKQRESETEKKLQSKLKQIEKYESELRNGLEDIERYKHERDRERKELSDLRSKLSDKHSRTSEEQAKALLLTEDKFLDRLNVEKATSASLRLELEELKEKFAMLESVQAASSLGNNEGKDYVKQLERSNESLEARVKVLSDSKNHYKKLWQDAVHELQLVKENEGEQHNTNQITTASKPERISKEHQVFSEIFEAVDNLKLQTQQEYTESPSVEIVEEKSASEEKVMRLIDERDALLRTGLYRITDAVITEIDRQITELLDRAI